MGHCNILLNFFLGKMLLWVHMAKRRSCILWNFEMVLLFINSPCRERCSVMLHTDTVHLLTSVFIGPHLICQSSFLVLSGRQTGRLSDCQSAIITLTMAHCSAAPQTPGKLPRLLTFPLGKNYVNGFYMVHTLYPEIISFNKAREYLGCHHCSWLQWLASCMLGLGCLSRTSAPASSHHVACLLFSNVDLWCCT